MAATIDATVGGSASNAYPTLEEADAYNATYPQDADGSLWNDLDVDLKNRAIIQATRQFETAVRWYGYSTNQAVQKLAWPRVGLIYPNTGAIVPSSIIPDELKWAVSEQARIIAASDRTQPSDAASGGLKRLRADVIELEFVDQDSPGQPAALQTIAPSAWQYVAGWGVIAQAGDGGAIPLARV